MTHVTVIVSAHCGLCDHATEVLQRVACDVPLTIEVLPLDSDRGREMALTAGMAFPPAVFIDGEPFSYGRLSERQLRRELLRHTAVTTTTEQ